MKQILFLLLSLFFLSELTSARTIAWKKENAGRALTDTTIVINKSDTLTWTPSSDLKTLSFSITVDTAVLSRIYILHFQNGVQTKPLVGDTLVSANDTINARVCYVYPVPLTTPTEQYQFVVVYPNATSYFGALTTRRVYYELVKRK